MSDTPKPGWLSFSIRDLLWLTALVAVVLRARYERPTVPGRYVMEHHPALFQTYVLSTPPPVKAGCATRAATGSMRATTPPA